MSKPPPNWPDFDSELLRAIAGTLRARSKAIRYRGTLCCTQDWSEESGGTLERLNADVESLLGERVRLSVWHDGSLWLLVCKPAPRRSGGWAFKSELHADVGGTDPAEIVRRLEETFALCHSWKPRESPGELRRLWAARA